MSTSVAGLSNSRLLRFKLNMVLPEYLATSRALFDHPRLAELLPDYWFVVHSTIRATVPLMQAALDRSRALADTDPVARALADYFPVHIVEETGHDDWLLDDIQAAGMDRDEFLRRVPPASVAAMVGSQYYWIAHFHPVALLGYIAVMEGYVPTVDHLTSVAARLPYPLQSYRMMLEHAEIDGDHRRHLHDLLDVLPLSREQTAAVGLSALETMRQGCSSVRELLDRAPSGQE